MSMYTGAGEGPSRRARMGLCARLWGQGDRVWPIVPKLAVPSPLDTHADIWNAAAVLLRHSRAFARQTA
jgi:hypothetical protein